MIPMIAVGHHFNILPGADATRPDLYVELRQFASSDIIYRSDTKTNASISNTYIFTDPSSSNGGSLPHNLAYSTHYIINLMDDDGLSADDFMSSMDITPESLYTKDNATTFSRSFFDNETLTTFKLNGEWVY